MSRREKNLSSSPVNIVRGPRECHALRIRSIFVRQPFNPTIRNTTDRGRVRSLIFGSRALHQFRSTSQALVQYVNHLPGSRPLRRYPVAPPAPPSSPLGPVTPLRGNALPAVRNSAKSFCPDSCSKSRLKEICVTGSSFTLLFVVRRLYR